MQQEEGMDFDNRSGGGEASTTLKRQRDFSSSEDDAPSSQEPLGSEKHFCLHPSGEENPLLQRAGSPIRPRLWLAEQAVKPDTPAVPSIQSRMRLLTQRQERAAPLVLRCLSDPGLEGLHSCSPHAEGEEFREELRLIGDAEFRSRVELFEWHPPLDGPSLQSPRVCFVSSFIRSIQLKLESAETPSSSRAEQIHQEREQHLRLLSSQPISDNAWLKRSWSEPFLAKQLGPGVQAKDIGSTEGQPELDDHRKVEMHLPISLETSPQQEEAWSPSDLRKEAETPSAASQEEATSGFGENEGLSGGQQEKAGSQGSLQEEAQFQSEEQEEAGCLEAELSSHEEMNTSEMIDQMFKGVLDITEEEEEEEDEEEGAGSGSGPELGEKKKEQKESVKIEVEESKPPDSNVDKLLSIPSSWILSPLGKAVEAELTLLGLGPSHLPDPPPLLLTVKELTPPPEVDSMPLYSIDTYRTQQQNSQQAVQNVTTAVHKRAPERTCPVPPVNIKEKIMLLNEEAARMQSVVTQTLQALSCCTDQGHGKGSLEEAEAEKLLLVSCEKRSALLAEVSQLRVRGRGDRGLDSDILVLEPCRGTVTISNLQLPLKVEFLYSTRMRSGSVTSLSSCRTGQPTQYYFVLIRYGAYNIVATPLATVADARNGDTVSFPTSITLQDIRSNFQIDVEVYSLLTTGNNFNVEQCSTKYKMTLKRLLKSITGSNRSIAAATLPSISSRRSSNFSLIGSHKITLASLGQSKFPLDKVPFLSHLEGNICLRLQCEGHSHIQHHGFLTMFEDVGGFGVWNRCWFSLKGSGLSYWSYPNYEHSKAAEGNISLASCTSQCVRPVNRDLCARPCTFELVSTRTLQQDRLPVLHKCWFSHYSHALCLVSPLAKEWMDLIFY
ncbi:hypothetical protein AAFF_G00422070 [Aldrovandia affinis]|uniref:Anillin homology domain-containing protein n=1 Tax=Aldrovandia affinis TaxID=143900 RepID=A0AAD7SA06_9TELE|nr:hypothetical protein AAFF_G00422070 [Aldrovandia affinis]